MKQKKIFNKYDRLPRYINIRCFKLWNIWLCLCLLPLCSLYSEDRVEVEYWDSRDGLANNTVRALFQDSRGYVWMSTSNGVSRYDGYTFINYIPQPHQSITLADRRVNTIAEDKYGFLWFTTADKRVSCLDPRTNSFVDFTGCGEYRQHYAYCLIEEDDVWLWGHHNGCRRITYRNGSFASQSFSTGNKQMASDYVYFVQGDHKQRVWVGTRDGLYRFSAGEWECIVSGKAFTSMKILPGGDSIAFCTGNRRLLLFNGHTIHPVEGVLLPPASDICGDILVRNTWLFYTQQNTYAVNFHSLSMQPVTGELHIPGAQAYQDERGIYWLHNGSGRLYRVSPQTAEVRAFTLSHTPVHGNERFRVAYDTRGIAWIGSNVNGLFSYDEAHHSFRHYRETDVPAPLVSSDAVLSVMADRSGGLWVGGDCTGASHFRFMEEQSTWFYVEDSQSVHSDGNNIRLVTRLANGDIMVATRNGCLYRYNATLTRRISREAFPQNVYAVGTDSRGVLWKALQGGGLLVGNTPYRFKPGNSHSISFDYIYCMLHDRDGRTWLGSLGKGMDVAVPDGKDGYVFGHYLRSTYAQSNVRTLVQDKQGWIWAGTNDGVYIFRPDAFLKDGSHYHYLPGEVIKQIKEDSKGTVYLSVAGDGIALSKAGRDYSHIRMERYGTASGLVNATVQAFVEDRAGRMWMTTEGGVSCFDPKRRTFHNHFLSSEARRNVYNDGAALLLDDGRLAFGTRYGLQLVSPDRLNTVLPQASSPVFTRMEAGGGEVVPNGDIRLKYSQRTFTVSFSTLDYPLSAQPQYSYQLEGYEKEWSTPCTLNFAVYKSLPPGSYKLWVKARHDGGSWSTARALHITVLPPFWLTPWAYLSYALLLGLLAYIVWRIVEKMNKLRNRVKVETRLTEYKLAFFTNISHEFRTPITLIQAALERLHKKVLPVDEASSVKLMAKSANRLLRLVDQLIEFRKIEDNTLQLSLESTDVVAFAYDIYHHFEDRATLKNMDFRFESNLSLFQMYIDREKLDKVLYNLLSNAFKYTPSGGGVCFSLNADAGRGMIQMRVADTGIGIPKEKQGELFGRFMQSSFSRNSMGIGLSLAAGLVKLMKGSIAYQDNPGGGAVFIVTLPTDEKLFAENDFLSAHSVLLREEEQWKEEMNNIEKDIVDGEPQPQAIAPMNGKKLLVIEDDDDMRAMLKDELSPYFLVETCADGEEGMKYATHNEVDLIVCDVMMPGLSGYEVTARLKADFATSHIPVVLLTALNDERHYLEGIQSGADAYVTKPFRFRLLLSRITHLMKQRDALRAKFSKDLSCVRPVLCITSEEKRFAEKLDKILAVQLANSEYSAEDFAADAGMSRTAFYKKVKGLTGYAPKEYIRMIRLKKAAEMLLKTDLTVAEVSYSVGINDPLYFSRCFKAQFGMPPTVYQKENRK